MTAAMTLADVMAGVREMEWADRALCAEVDPELFFPEKGQPVISAKRVCMACEVRAECLEYAIDRGEQHGIWGGLSAEQRRRVKAARVRDAA